MGIGISTFMTFSKGAGLYIKLNWMGVMLPIKDLKPEMLDKTFYDTLNANYEDYVMSYERNGDQEAVRVDFRGFDATIGVVLYLY